MEWLFAMRKDIGIAIRQWPAAEFMFCSKAVVSECAINIVLSSMAINIIWGLLIGTALSLIAQIDFIRRKRNVVWLLSSHFYSCFAWLESSASVEVINMIKIWACQLTTLVFKLSESYMYYGSRNLRFILYIIVFF